MLNNISGLEARTNICRFITANVQVLWRWIVGKQKN